MGITRTNVLKHFLWYLINECETVFLLWIIPSGHYDYSVRVPLVSTTINLKTIFEQYFDIRTRAYTSLSTLFIFRTVNETDLRPDQNFLIFNIKTHNQSVMIVVVVIPRYETMVKRFFFRVETLYIFVRWAETTSKLTGSDVCRVLSAYARLYQYLRKRNSLRLLCVRVYTADSTKQNESYTDQYQLFDGAQRPDVAHNV